MTSGSGEHARYRVTRLDGWPIGSGPEALTEPGATFQVIDTANGQLAAAYRSEDCATGLPPLARVAMAGHLAEARAAALSHAAGATPPA